MNNIKNFNIRLAEKKDIKEVYKMLQEHVKYEKITEKFKLSEKRLQENIFKENIRWHCLVVEDLEDKSLKGILLYSINYINRAFHLKSKVHIDHLYIRPAYRRFGIGVALINEIKKHLNKQNMNTIELWCMKSNKNADKFYRKIGFQEVEAYIFQLKI